MGKRLTLFLATLSLTGLEAFQERRRCVDKCTDPLSCTLGGGTPVKGTCTGIFSVCCSYNNGGSAPRHRWRSKPANHQQLIFNSIQPFHTNNFIPQAMEFKPSQPDPLTNLNQLGPTNYLTPVQQNNINQGQRNPRHLKHIFKGRPRKLLRQPPGGQRLSGLGQRSPGVHLGGQRYLGGGFRHLIGNRKPRFTNHNLYTSSPQSNNLWNPSTNNITNLIKSIKVKRPDQHKRLRKPISFIENEIITSHEECGVSQAAQARILGGLDAGNGQFPWAALIHIKGPDIDKLCAGTLISSRYVLTAGHCTSYCRFISIPECTDPVPMKELIFKVTLGEYDYEDTNYDQKEILYAVNAYVHPYYKSNLRIRNDGYLESDPHYDVSILELESDIKPSPYIAPICLPDPDMRPFGSLATVVGWGRVERDPGSQHSSVLQATTVPMLTPQECNQMDPSLSPTEDQLCAGLANTDTSACPGDSGGGLMSRNGDGIWFLLGIVSTGPAVCGLTPVIYHNVTASLPWIKSIIHQPVP